LGFPIPYDYIIPYFFPFVYTLFYESVGRTDFPGGNFKTLKKSLDKLMALGNNYIVLPGLGKETTIEYEKENNVYINEY
jgi:glyoxylase-like metal-dependent hydrolase (beta-lactamase superfamily II)